VKRGKHNGRVRSDRTHLGILYYYHYIWYNCREGLTTYIKIVYHIIRARECVCVMEFYFTRYRGDGRRRYRNTRYLDMYTTSAAFIEIKIRVRYERNNIIIYDDAHSRRRGV